MNSAHKKSAPCPERLCERVADTCRAITVSDVAGDITRLSAEVPPAKGAKEKGAAGGHALWLCASADHSSGVSDFLRRCRRFISPCIDVMINCEVLSPGSFTFSISSTTSCGTLDLRDCDFAFVVPVAISIPPCNRWATEYRKFVAIKTLTWTTPLKYSGPHLGVSKLKKQRSPAVLEHIPGL